MHGFGEEMCFRSAEELAATTQAGRRGDQWNHGHASMCPLRSRSCAQDYDMLLEKPFADQ